MPDPLLQTLDPKTGKPPETRILDASSLNSVIKKIIELDSGSALARVDVQKMLDGAPPFDPTYLRESGQDGRCNLNFGDGKAMVKAEMAGYYDLTDSVPTLALVLSEFGDPALRPFHSAVISEEFHRLLKDWKSFDTTFQLHIQHFCSHGMGFLYFKDDVDWRWETAGLDEFKLPRNTKLLEDEIDLAVVLREVTVGKLYSWIKDIPDDDKRWNKQEVREAILRAADQNFTAYSSGLWEKWQQMAKNNDVFASASAQDTVHLAHAWMREFSGKVSHYVTLLSGTNKDFLFHTKNRFKDTSECFTFFPYEIGTNSYIHSIRGKAQEVYAAVQILNGLRCQTVDNAKFSGSLLLQPATETDAQDMAILFFGGATYIPPGVKVQNTTFANPSTNVLPIIREMSLLMKENSGDTAARSADNSTDKTKYERQSDDVKQSVLPTASMNLFYQPWGRHLNEVWRRVSSRTLKKTDPGAEAVFAMRERIIARNVPEEAIFQATQVTPVRAIGYGSPTMRLMALDEFMQFYGSLDPVGQNNLLRDRFAQKVGYSQVDRYVPLLDQAGRTPLDQEIAELQNLAMSQGIAPSVLPNDHHVIHSFAHLPSLTGDLDLLESGQGTPQLLSSAQLKAQHISDHLHYLKPDKLNAKIVSELQRQANNALERVKAATVRAERDAARQQQQDAQELEERRQTNGPSPKAQQDAADSELTRQMQVADHELKTRLETASHTQKMAFLDAENARMVRSNAARDRFRNGAPVTSAPTPPTPAPLPQPAAPAVAAPIPGV